MDRRFIPYEIETKNVSAIIPCALAGILCYIICLFSDSPLNIVDRKLFDQPKVAITPESFEKKEEE